MQYPETVRVKRNTLHWRYVHAQELLNTIEASASAKSAKHAAALQRTKPSKPGRKR
jgi:hypothetical protein